MASGLGGRPPGSERFLQQDHRAAELEAAAAALEAGLDEGLLSLSLPNLLCMENPYSYKTFQ